MPSISNKWIDKLDMLPARDYITLTKAILRGEPEPQITPKYQGIASEIYGNLRERERVKNAVRKSRCNSNVTVTSSLRNSNVTCYVTQEEKREAPPPCSPSSSPPHPLIITPYNPPTKPPHEPTPQEKRENTPGGVPPLPDRQGDSVNAGVRAGNSLQEKTQSQYSPCFEELWNTYPKKSGKKPAYESYKRAKRDGVTDEEIIAGKERYKDYIKAKRLSERYILDGSTYFYQRRWEDVYELPPDSGDDYGGDAFSRLLNAELDKIQNRFGGTVR